MRGIEREGEIPFLPPSGARTQSYANKYSYANTHTHRSTRKPDSAHTCTHTRTHANIHA